MKGVLCHGERVVLVGNSRGEWELPGGKLELGETPETCVAREIAEELDLAVAVGPLLDAWVYDITPEVHVLVLVYGCRAATVPEHLVSPEGQPVGALRRGRARGHRAAGGLPACDRRLVRVVVPISVASHRVDGRLPRLASPSRSCSACPHTPGS